MTKMVTFVRIERRVFLAHGWRSDQVKDGVKKDPHNVNEVPVQARHLDLSGTCAG